MNARERRRRAILRHRRRGTPMSRTSWLTAPDPFKVLQGVRVGGLDMETKLRRGLLEGVLPSEAELLARIFPEDQEDEGEPLMRTLTGYDALLINKYGH